MKNQQLIILLAVITATLLAACSDSTAEQRASRRYNAEGNEHYEESRYKDAETSYTKAVSSDASNLEAKYNLALSMIRQAGAGESGKKLLDDARKMLTEVMEATAADSLLASHAAYNIGNMAYNVQQWDPAIAAYKQSLRFNPDDDYARENLRLAQLKKNEEQNQDQNQDRNQDQQDQQKQDQKDKQDQDQKQDQNNPDQNKDNQNQQPPQPQGGISDENAEKILKAMENEEAATRRRVQEAEKRKAEASGRRVVTNPW